MTETVTPDNVLDVARKVIMFIKANLSTDPYFIDKVLFIALEVNAIEKRIKAVYDDFNIPREGGGD